MVSVFEELEESHSGLLQRPGTPWSLLISWVRIPSPPQIAKVVLQRGTAFAILEIGWDSNGTRALP